MPIHCRLILKLVRIPSSFPSPFKYTPPSQGTISSAQRRQTCPIPMETSIYFISDTADLMFVSQSLALLPLFKLLFSAFPPHTLLPLCVFFLPLTQPGWERHLDTYHTAITISNVTFSFSSQWPRLALLAICLFGLCFNGSECTCVCVCACVTRVCSAPGFIYMYSAASFCIDYMCM